MTRVKLKQLARKLNKNISDIARETGLNRNTVTKLFHSNVDGVKFDTLDKICNTYKVSISELIGVEIPTEENEQTHGVFERTLLPQEIYRQEGQSVPFTMWPPMRSIRNTEYFSCDYGPIGFFFTGNYGFWYYEKSAMRQLAEHAFERYSKPEAHTKLFNIFLEKARVLENLYFDTDPALVIEQGRHAIPELLASILGAYEDFWSTSIFIDSFDVGYDQEKIQEIAGKYGLTKDEIVTLTTPTMLMLGNERLHAVLNLAKTLMRKRITHKDKDKIKHFVESAPEVVAYIKAFDYYRSNYATVDHITKDEVVQELTTYLKDISRLKEEHKELQVYSRNQEAAVKKVLNKYKLSENPLAFFQLLTYWREYRKKVNLMGFHLLDIVLSILEQETGIPKKYLAYAHLDEVDHVLRGFVTFEVLKSRREGGLLSSVDEYANFRVIFGEEAQSLRSELEQRMEQKIDTDIISGQVASQGYAKGVAKIVLGQEDFDKLKEGEILITGMTRPEFVPLMKKAGAIVTNEGGITCHAAIVSRELGKPCIIGTQVATQMIRDGDTVEVRAHHGTVRIIRK